MNHQLVNIVIRGSCLIVMLFLQAIIPEPGLFRSLGWILIGILLVMTILAIIGIV